MPKPWAGYIRVSHVGGRDGDSFRSPTDQQNAITQWAKRRSEPIEILTPELDASGGDNTRPILEQAITGIEDGQYRGLVVAYLSRISRSTQYTLELWTRIENAGGQIVAVNENIDTSTPQGKLTRTMLAAIAEHELDLHRERFANQRASATQRGIWQQPQIPLGYDKDPNTRRLTPNNDAEKVREIFRKAAGGASLASLGRELNMTASGVRYMLNNRVYLGELKSGPELNPEAHPPILTLDEFTAAKPPNRPRAPRVFDELPLLAGLIRCGGCSHAMSRYMSPNGPAYRCRNNINCPNPVAIRGHKIDPHVEHIALTELRKLTVNTIEATDHIDQARTELIDAEAELTAYLQAVNATDIGIEAFNKGARIRSDNVEAARIKLAELATPNETAAINADIADRWQELSVEHQNRVLRGLLEAVVVYKGKHANSPVEERVIVLRAGAGIVTHKRHRMTDKRPIAPVVIEPDNESILRV